MSTLFWKEFLVGGALYFFKAALSIDRDYDVALEGKEIVTNILESKN